MLVSPAAYPPGAPWQPAHEAIVEAAERTGVRVTLRVPFDAVERTDARVAHLPNVNVQGIEPGGGSIVFLAKKRDPKERV